MPRTIIENIVIEDYKDADAFEFCQYTSIRFFEILYFETGTGVLKINGHDVAYTPNSIFVFIPNDVYIVRATSTTTVTTIKFLKSFFSGPMLANPIVQANDWFRKIEIVLNNENNLLRELEFRLTSDKKNLSALINMLCLEYTNEETNDLVIIKNSLSIILQIISRNIRQLSITKTFVSQDSKIQDIIDFIHEHIYESHLLTNKALAKSFNIADTYIGQYFKKYMGISIKKYILNYKLTLVETRLKYTDLHISEIASELGFTDSSHLNKTFLSYKGVTTAAYKASHTKKN